MNNIKYLTSSVIILFGFLLICHLTKSDSQFECKKDGRGNVPELPKAYSTSIRLNFLDKEYTLEMKYAKNDKEKKELFVFKRSGRYVKYIKRGDEGSTLFIEYPEKKQPKCEVIKSIYMKDFLKKEDSGEQNIILKALEVMMAPSQYNIYSTGPAEDTGVWAVRYEGCLRDPIINISLTFSVKEWDMSNGSPTSRDVNYPETVVAEIGEKSIKGFYYNFIPSEPVSSAFEPSTDVFCKGFRSKRKPPKLPNYFSYGAEMVNYVPVKNGPVIPMISQRKVYYDYKDNISRIDFNDLLALDRDSFPGITAQKKSIIHDYNSGFQYIIDSFTGKCSVDTFQETFNAISFEESKTSKMITGTEFFWLDDDTETSYNGQFLHRGVMANVYTALRIDPKTKNPYIISWYFSTELAQVAENENVEKNVLLSMYVRPETELGKDKVTEIHFFDFVSEEPDVFSFDLTKCYNETTSKTLVFTFPAHDALRGSEKLVGRLLNIAIKDITGVRKHRIYTKEVIFSGKYMYSEFSLLEHSPRGPADKKMSLDDALEKLQSDVSKGSFLVKVPVDNTTVLLKPEPNGLNVFAGDRARIEPKLEGFRESSVIGLTIGMLILGFVLGMVAVNLIINRKHGVSLFQKSRFVGSKGFEYSSNESSM